MAGFLVNTPDAEKFAPKYFTDSNLILPFDRLITQAEAQALNTTALDLITAPATDYYIQLFSDVFICYKYNGTAWAADDVWLYFNSLGTGAATFVFPKLDFQNTADFIKRYVPDDVTQFKTADKITLKANANFTNNGSPFRVQFMYRIAPIS